MTKQEALQLFASHIDILALKADFPDLDYFIMELEDGQQEIVIRLQGEDADYHPAGDIAVIEAMSLNELPAEDRKTVTFLRKYKTNKVRARKHRRDIALLKRIKALIGPAGLSLRKIAKVIQHNLPAEDIEL